MPLDRLSNGSFWLNLALRPRRIDRLLTGGFQPSGLRMSEFTLQRLLYP
jgi:hypothetical protein